MSIILTQSANRVRKVSAPDYGDGVEASVALNPRGETLTAQGLPPYTELSRLGCGWQVMDTSATAGLVIRPSTVAGLTLYNGNAAGGASYIIDAVMAFNLVKTNVVEAWGVWACLHRSMTAPTADITAIKSMSGVATYPGLAVVDTGATVVDDGWFPIGAPGLGTGAGGVTPGMSVVIPIEGRFIVRPGGGISMNCVGSLVGQTFTHGFRWYEVQLNLI